MEDPYRSELGGVIGIVVRLTYLADERGQRTQPTFMARDGFSALKKVHSRKADMNAGPKFNMEKCGLPGPAD